MRVARLADAKVVVTGVPQRLFFSIGFGTHDLIRNSEQGPRVQAAYFRKLIVRFLGTGPERVQNRRSGEQFISYE
jgi:hypothetical protein